MATASPAARPSGKTIALITGILVGAVILGVVAAFAIRTVGGEGPAPPPGTPAPTAPPVSPDPLETPDPVPTGPLGEAVARSASGTHRLLAVTCAGTGIGTAFQFGADGLLVTSAYAVSGARSVVVLAGDRAVPATVVKIDTHAGLAMLEPEVPLGGHVFELGTRQLAVGDEVVALGWTTEAQQPARGRGRTPVGTISEAGVAVESPVGQHAVRRMTGAYDAGLAGAPVIDGGGRLLGMLLHTGKDQTEILVTGLDTIADPLLGPTGRPPVMEPCLTASGPQIVTTVGGPAPTATRTSLGQWFGALNAGEWERARGALGGSLREEWTPEKLAEAHRGSFAFNIVSADAGDEPGVRVSWTRLNPEGRSCERHVARVALDQGGISEFTPDGEPVPCG
ncbi:MAG: trypsin-like peptidase domain-containing protein [Propionibacteriaceae bacterium]|nr:trypsin-like peptidase domain-containing protein [Propionibacteriaceae bacterium]